MNILKVFKETFLCRHQLIDTEHTVKLLESNQAAQGERIVRVETCDTCNANNTKIVDKNGNPLPILPFKK